MHAPTRPHMAPRQGPTAPSHAVSNYPVTRYPLGVGVWLLRLASPLLRFTSSSVRFLLRKETPSSSDRSR
eukprot:5040661-Pyramimonas_sp.AAC.1